MDKNLTERVKEIAKEKGADFVGIGSVDRFKNAPLMLSPLGLLPGSKSVIVVG
jgi:epoxyqueuosine reductase